MTCSHPLRMDDLCAVCGMNVGKSKYSALISSDKLSLNKDEAKKIRKEHHNKLKDENRLILIVDLDQTIVDTVAVANCKLGGTEKIRSIDKQTGGEIGQDVSRLDKEVKLEIKSVEDGIDTGFSLSCRESIEEQKMKSINNGKLKNAIEKEGELEGSDENETKEKNKMVENEAVKKIKLGEEHLERSHVYDNIKTVNIDDVGSEGFLTVLGGIRFIMRFRPGTLNFLKYVHKYYQLYVYSMGTREYVAEVLKIIDKDGTLFENRVITRDENHSKLTKSIERIAYGSKKNALVLDDREDVWIDEKNLVLIRPYRYKHTIQNKEDSDMARLIPDKDLRSTAILLEQVHSSFFASKNSSVYKIYRKIRRGILKNVRILPLSEEIKRLCKRYGAKIRNKRYDYIVGYNKIENIKVVNILWVLECIYQAKLINVEPYIM